MNWKTVVKALLFPPVWVMIVLAVISAVALPWIFLEDQQESPLAYAVYVVAFYTVCVIGVTLGTVLPGRYKAVKQRVYDDPLANRYLTDAAFRTYVSLYTSLGINVLYIAVNAVSGVLNHTAWFWILAVYYAILAIMRFVLTRYVRRVGIGKDRLGEWKSARLCSCLLLTLNIVLSGAVLMMLYQNKGFDYHGILIYVMAMYTFFITANAIRHLVIDRKYKSPVMTTTKIITFSAALVSMLSLETAMLSQFGGDMSADDRRLMIALTGAGISIVVITMSVSMIVRSVKEIQTIRRDHDE